MFFCFYLTLLTQYKNSQMDAIDSHRCCLSSFNDGFCDRLTLVVLISNKKFRELFPFIFIQNRFAIESSYEHKIYYFLFSDIGRQTSHSIYSSSSKFILFFSKFNEQISSAMFFQANSLTCSISKIIVFSSTKCDASISKFFTSKRKNSLVLNSIH